MPTTTETYTFRKGQTLQLDWIYTIQGLAGGDWWTAEDPGTPGQSPFGRTGGETITITRDITIKVIAKSP